MERYEAYKDSRIEWIGEIPVGWEVKTLKRFAKICNGRDHKDVWDLNGNYPVIGSGGVFGRASIYLYDKPSVILGRKGTIDKPQFITEPFWSVDTAYFTDIYENTDKKFFYYLCLTINFELYKYGSAVPSMTQEVLSQIPFCAPPKNEQTAIANYLDCKTAEIDALIAQKQRLIELYEEEKTAIINQAVTQGIDPDAKLKESGIDWLGEIPASWEVKKLKYLVNILSGYSPEQCQPASIGDIEYIKVDHVNNTNFEIRESEEFVERDLIAVKNNAILFPKRGAAIGLNKVGLVNRAISFDTNLMALEIKSSSLLVHYLAYMLKNYSLISIADTSTIPQINNKHIAPFEMPLPSIDEQTAIVHHIETETARIDAKIAKTRRIIELQKEYRAALISEVVTGKIKVSQLAEKEIT